MGAASRRPPQFCPRAVASLSPGGDGEDETGGSGEGLPPNPSPSLFSSHRGLRLQPHDELVRLGVHELLRELEERDLLGAHHEAEVLALQHEDHPIFQAVGHRLLADQRPLLGQPAVLVVLDGGSGRQVPLQERLGGGKGHVNVAFLRLSRGFFCSLKLLGRSCRKNIPARLVPIAAPCSLGVTPALLAPSPNPLSSCSHTVGGKNTQPSPHPLDQVLGQTRRPVPPRRAPPVHLGRHVVGDAELEVLQDALHGVVGLLLGGAQVFLHGPGHGGEDGLSRLPWVHDLPGVLLVLLLQPLDVGEGFFHRHHQPAGRKAMGAAAPGQRDTRAGDPRGWGEPLAACLPTYGWQEPSFHPKRVLGGDLAVPPNSRARDALPQEQGHPVLGGFR